jgi:cytochrome c
LKRDAARREAGREDAVPLQPPRPFENDDTLFFASDVQIERKLKMKSNVVVGGVLGLAFVAATLSFSGGALAFDEEAAKALAKKNDCTKCHAVDKEKKGPAYKKIAAKYKGKPDGEEKAIKNMTTASKVKLTDGSEEEHKIIDTKDPKALKNLAQWILAQ